MLSPVEKSKIMELIQGFRNAVGNLQKLKNASETEFLASFEKQGSVKYGFIVAIESAVDICNHIISEARLGQPREYAEVFRVMGEAAIFPADLVQDLERMAKFRKLLVHVYGKVDDRKVYEILQARLGDFERFESCILSYLRRSP